MRVVMLVQSYHVASFGGAERQIASLAPLLKERGVEVHVVTRQNPGTVPYEEVLGVPVHRAPVMRGPKGDTLTAAAYTVYTLAQIGRLRPDVIHAHGLFSPTVAAVSARRVFGTPVVAKALRGGVLGDVIRVRRKPRGERRVRALGRDVDGFITISDEIRCELLSIGVPPDKCYYIPNGVDTSRFKPADPETKRIQRAAKGIADRPTVLYVGRLVPEKRVDTLLAVWDQLRAEFPQAQLLIVGTGPEEKALRAQAGEGVQFIGRVDDVPAWLQLGDIFVLPSISEGLSNSLLEAMAAGLPIIASAVGEAPHLITSDEDGWLIPPDDAPALTSALGSALRDLNRTQLIGRHNRERILNDFQLSTTADKLVELYQKVLK
jgi:glycosyltransferase involved in cell wall biosynthesis